MNCIFCKIIKGEVPSYKIYEDEYTYAFLDIAKDYEGHTLVLPKEHFENIFDVNEQTLSNVLKTVKKISQHYIDDCGYDGVNIINNNKESAGQSVMHLHYHIIPRKTGDNIKIFNDNKQDMDLDALCQKLKLS